MTNEQFEELIMTLINGFESINTSIKAMSEKIDKPVEKVIEKIINDHDLDGIPLSSIHHPRNPEFINNPGYHWNENLNMWKKWTKSF